MTKVLFPFVSNIKLRMISPLPLSGIILPEKNLLQTFAVTLMTEQTAPGTTIVPWNSIAVTNPIIIMQ